jgi:hypothetical protein
MFRIRPITLGAGRRARVLPAVSAALVAVLAVGIGAAAPAQAAPAPATPVTIPDGMSQAMYHQMMAQIPLERVADQIQAAAARPGAGHDGFFDTWLDVDHHTVTVYWHGTMPGDIAALIAGLRSPSVTVRVASARYSMTELTAAVRRGLTQPGVLSGQPLNDGSGIQLNLAQAGPATHAGLAGAAAPDLGSTLTASLGVPVRTGTGGPVTFQATCVFSGGTALAAPSRCDDRQPGYWGGNVIINTANGSGCSSAFGMHSVSTGLLYLATAAHCSENASGTPVNGVTFTNGDRTQTVGTSVDVPGPHDEALIGTSSGNQYYDGPGIYAGDTHNTKRVVGQGGVSINQSLCESGAFGGVICGFTVEAINVSPTGDPFNSLTEAVSTTGRYTIAGDSGGPWFTLAGTGTVTARGIHEGLTIDGAGNQVELFTPITVLANDSGVAVNT